MIMIMIGDSLYNNYLNSFTSFLHIICCVELSIFILDSSPASDLWRIWIYGGLSPVVVEIFAHYITNSNFKSANNYKN